MIIFRIKKPLYLIVSGIFILINCVVLISPRAADREASFALPSIAEESSLQKELPDQKALVTNDSVPTKNSSSSRQEETVAAEPLDPINPDSAGLLSPSVGGLGASIWENTPRALVEHLISDLKLPTNSPTINSLARRLLLSAAAVPQGESTLQNSFISLRLEKLLALGDVANAWQLAQKVKSANINENTMRRLVETALVGTESKEICNRVPELMARYNNVEWQKALILCQLRAGDSKAVQLGLDVMREQQGKDDMFITIANRALLGGSKRLPRQLTPLSPLVLGILKQMDLPLPPDLYARPDSALIPELLLAKAESVDMRLALAEKAAAKGIITGSQLAAVYRSVEMPPETLAGALNSKETGLIQHAALFQAAAAEIIPVRKAELVAKFMQTVETTLLCGSGSQALAEIAASIPVNVEAGAFSAQLARLMALAGKPERALEWLNIARSVAVKTQSVAMQLQTYWPLFVLTGIITDAEYGANLKDWLDGLLLMSGNDYATGNEKRNQAATVLAMFSAAGYAIPESMWLKVASIVAESKKMIVPSAILLERLRNAGINNRRGEAVLLTIFLAGGGISETPLFVIADAVRTLRLVGLKSDALALAREAVAGYQ